MQLKYKLSLLVSLVILSLPTILSAQQKVLIVFTEDEKFNIPYKFLKNKDKGTQDSVPMKFLTLKYQFYNQLTQSLVSNNYSPIGGVNNDMNSVRKYTTKKWFAHDSISQAKLDNKKYLAAKVDETNKGYYNLYANGDSADYIIFINKIEVGGNILRRWFAMKNYLMLVHFDIYDANMKHLGGQYLRKKVKLTKDMYWSAFQTHFSSLPNELALHFANFKK